MRWLASHFTDSRDWLARVSAGDPAASACSACLSRVRWPTFLMPSSCGMVEHHKRRGIWMELINGSYWLLRTQTRLVKFPGHSYLQYLIAYSMQLRRGKAWEILWHLVMTDDRHTGGQHPTVLTLISCLTVPGTMNDKQYWCRLANALASSPWSDSTRKGRWDSLLGTTPNVSTLSVFAYCKRSNEGLRTRVV